MLKGAPTAMIVRLSAYKMDLMPVSLMIIQVVFLQQSQLVSLWPGTTACDLVVMDTSNSYRGYLARLSL